MNVPYMIVLILFLLILIILATALAIIRKKADASWNMYVHRKIRELDHRMQMMNGNGDAYILVEADRLLDYVFKKKRYPGKTMSERLKYAKKSYSWKEYQSIWEAHKVRNMIVHDEHARVSNRSLYQHYGVFRQAIRRVLH